MVCRITTLCEHCEQYSVTTSDRFMQIGENLPILECPRCQMAGMRQRVVKNEKLEWKEWQNESTEAFL